MLLADFRLKRTYRNDNLCTFLPFDWTLCLYTHRGSTYISLFRISLNGPGLVFVQVYTLSFS